MRPRPTAAVAAVVVLAGVLATLAAFRPVLSPPGLHARLQPTHVATGRMLVDRHVSVLAGIDADPTATSLLALTYVQLLRTDHARIVLAAAARLPPGSVRVEGPYTTLLNRSAPPSRIPLPEETHGAQPYRVLLDVSPNRPVITVVAAAPRRAAARALVLGAAAFLRDEVAAARRSAPPDRADTAVLRSLGPVVVRGGSHRPQTAALFAVVFAGVLAAAGGVARRRRRGVRVPRPAWARSDDWPHTRRPLPWALAAFTGMIWLVPFAAVQIPGKLDRLALGAFMLVWMTARIGERRRGEAASGRVWITGVHGSAAALFAISAAGVVLNASALANLGELPAAIKQVTLLASMLAFFLVAGSALRPAEVRPFVSFMLGLAAVVAVGTLVELHTGTAVFYSVTSLLTGGRAPLPVTDPDSIGRVTIYGPTVHPLELAAMLAVAVVLAFVRVLDAHDRRSHLLSVLLCGLLLAGTLATVRKTSVVAPVAGLLVVAAYRPRAMARQALPMAVGFGLLVHLLAPGTVGSVVAQLHPSATTQTLSTRDRAADYSGVAPDVARHLLLGRGYGSYDHTKYRILDNQYLGLLVQTGLLGLAAYLALLASALAVMHRVTRARDRVRATPALGAGAAIAVLATASALFDLLSFPHVVYLLFLLCALLTTLDAPDTPDLAPRRILRLDLGGLDLGGEQRAPAPAAAPAAVRPVTPAI